MPMTHTGFFEDVKLFDGAMGTMLFDAGHTGQPALAVRDAAALVKKVHMDYILAGADVISTNTFGMYRNTHADAAENISAAVSLAREAVHESGRKAMVALDIGPTGLMLEPYGDVTSAELITIFRDAILAGADCDLILLETFTDLNELLIAVNAAKNNSHKPVICSMSFGRGKRTAFGVSVQNMLDALLPLEPAALGFNCCDITMLCDLITAARERTDMYILCQPNAGLPKMHGGVAVYNMSPYDFAKEMLELPGKNLIFGGCCGTTPEHISALVGHFER